MFEVLSDISKRRELLWMLVIRNLKIRYKSSVLGFFWSLLTPLLFIAIYAIFAKILKFSANKPDYFKFLIVGIVVWQFLAMCLNDSLGAIIGNANLIKKTQFPRLILPMAMLIANLINFLLTVAILLLYLVFARADLSGFVILPAVVLTQCALCLGLGLILSVANVFFRDTEHILGVLTLAWFFLTPIFYPVDMQLAFFRPDLAWLAFLNPMTGIVSFYRLAFTGEAGASLPMSLCSFAVSWVILVVGTVIFQRAVPRLADEM